MRLDKIGHKRFHITFLLLINVSMLLLTVVSGRLISQDSKIQIGGASLPGYSLTGILQSILFVGCILVTLISYEVGTRISLTLIAFVVLLDIMGIVLTRSLAPLPGLLNALLNLVMIYIIGKQFRIVEMESVTDYVTGLYNMRGFLDTLNQKIEKRMPFSLLYFRIDNFRMINDNLGHDMGTKLLQEVGTQLVEMTKGFGTVCKIGGSEYALVLDSEYRLEDFRKGMKERFGGKVALEDADIPIYCYPRVCCGAVRYPEDALDASTLVRYVDMALYHALKTRNSTMVSFNEEMSSEIIKQNEMESIIKECLAGDYFYLMYQPQYDMQDKKLRGFETLLRTLLPDGRSVSPADFIPVAEKTNLIIQIDWYVLKRALTEMVEHIRDYDHDIILSVNVSANSIGREDFAGKLIRLIKETGFPSERLELEITEYSFADSESMTIENIEKLRGLGIKIALDDFGTGYTSLAQLVKLPINLLKIDKSLVDDIETSEMSRDFVNAVIYMGHLMECDVISEGVESQMQVDLLREQNCDYVQGFVWDRPLYYEAAVAMLKRTTEKK